MPRGQYFVDAPKGEHQLLSSLGGHTSWANTEDRQARIEKIQAASPRDVAWHAKKLGLDPDNLTDAERKRAENARKAYFTRLAFASNRARNSRKRAAGERGGAA